MNQFTRLHVIGGTGFIGRHLCDTVIKKNIAPLRLLTRNIKRSTPVPSETIEKYHGDLNSKGSLRSFIKTNAIVINLAHPKASPVDGHLTAFQNLVDVCKEKGARRLVHCSTAVVVGKTNEQIVTEQTKCYPLTEYEKTKLSVENMLIERLKGSVEVGILRPTAVFGEGGKNLVKLADELTSGSRTFNSLKASLYYKRRLNLVCVQNVVSALLFLTGKKSPLDGEQFIISDDDDDANTYYDTIALLGDYLGMKPPKTIYMPFRYLVMRTLLTVLGRSNANIHRIYSSEKLVGMGFNKPIEYREGVKRFASWYRQSKRVAS